MMQNMEAKTAPMDTAELTARIDKLHYTIHHSEDFGSANSIIWQVEVGNQIEALISRWSSDTARIDKIERMAKASWKSFDSVAFSMNSSGDCSTLGYDKADGFPMGYKASYREAIDAATEPK